MDTALLTSLMTERQALLPLQASVPNTVALVDQKILQLMNVQQQSTDSSLIDAAASAGAPAACSNPYAQQVAMMTNPLLQQESLLQNSALLQQMGAAGAYASSNLLGCANMAATAPALHASMASTPSAPKVSDDALDSAGTAMISHLGTLMPGTSVGKTTGKGKGGNHRWIVPTENHPGFNLTGRIVGPKGSTLRGLQTTYNVRLFVRGKGSERPGAPKRSYTGAEVEEALHVKIEGGADGDVDGCIAALEALCAPVTDPSNDVIRQEQMGTKTAIEMASMSAGAMSGMGAFM
eukprot:CAMPEP_0119374160 /NCGR_PEP_ID=MMETSP1334-20130426/29491_1 /TAXON_ID=127549 /ORGANISM="Calcidiscus leptoporus, Strain RCC1130" /LENGTH=292 /DNA_ID=CAMNT_0007392153 /DNA_START=44 /DNA_END=922 /DNA_ORIENTATION=-